MLAHSLILTKKQQNVNLSQSPRLRKITRQKLFSKMDSHSILRIQLAETLILKSNQDQARTQLSLYNDYLK